MNHSQDYKCATTQNDQAGVLPGGNKARDGVILHDKSFQLESANSQAFGKEALQRLANLYNKQENYKGAALVYRRLLNLEPQNLFFLNHFALSLMMSGQIDLALQEMQKALDIFPDNELLLANLGKMLVVAKKWSEAQKTLHKALAISPGHMQEEIKQLIAYCHQMRSRLRAISSEADCQG